jgi:hypothetical protein
MGIPIKKLLNFPAKRIRFAGNPEKSYGTFKKERKKKSQTHNICVPGIMGTHNILQPFLWQALKSSEFSSPIIKPIKPPPNP